MRKALNKWYMVCIGIIHNTKYSEMSKHMGQVQDNPSIMCIWCSEDIVALNTMERAIFQHVLCKQVNLGNHVVQTSGAKMQHTRGNDGNHVM